ncbi:MAG: hypothetical protein LQ348_004286 [Seirophora lacunosa]|nr:MAG: hypothetical protein LQ348_004286 [Seirophora lacunosa]
MPSSCSARSCSSYVSESSSLRYDHEPFDQYTSKVRDLCRKLWPSATEDFVIERLRGGSYNRIIGITTPSSAGDPGSHYILRVPRFEEEGQQDRELVIHRYVAQHTSLPLADIVFFDLTNCNPLGSTYVVQTRLPGTTLLLAYPSLTHEQRKSVVRDFGTILLGLQAVKNETSGVVAATAQEDGARIYNVCRFNLEHNLVDYDYVDNVDDVDPLGDRAVLNMLLTQSQRWVARCKHLDPDDIFATDYFAQLSKVARQMDEAGVFDDNAFRLTHLDLEPQNILVAIGSDGHASISGVLDWDSAVFAPVFASCRPPSWLWAWIEEGEEDEGKANDIPENPEQRELKQMFEEIMGPAFLKYAYQPQYRMARSLFMLAKDGLQSTWLIEQAENLFIEWAEYTGSLDSPDAFTGIVADILRRTDIDDEAAADSDSQSVSDASGRLENNADSPIDEEKSPGATTVALSEDEAELIDEKTVEDGDPVIVPAQEELAETHQITDEIVH